VERDITALEQVREVVAAGHVVTAGGATAWRRWLGTAAAAALGVANTARAALTA
jgi:hypothetical protein